MIRRVVPLLAASMLLSAAGPASAAPKAPKKKPRPAPAATAKKVETPAPPVPDNTTLPADNGVRARVPPAAPPEAPPPAAPAPAGPAAAAFLGNDPEYDRRLLAQAVRMKLLKPTDAADALTPEVRNRMIDAHVLQDAVRHGLLPSNATPAQVTPEIRAVMKKGGYFVHYYPDGSVNPNYGGK